jgi:GT2 family glycosyltransferase
MSGAVKLTGSGKKATIVVVPRDRFTVARESLDNLIEQTPPPFDLVYVDGKSPPELADWLRQTCAERGFRYIRVERFLSPNEARNIGLREAQSEYVVFMDNDVICAPGWLEAMVACADETGADVVAPLTCHGQPAHTKIHQAGGEFAPDPEEFFRQPYGRRMLVDVVNRQDQKVADVRHELKRERTQCPEFHCMMARRSLFDRIGPFDEQVLATQEHVDFGIAVAQVGGLVMFEPASVVTYFHPNRQRPIAPSDWPYFLVRWSDDWQKRSLDRIREKWGVVSDGWYEQRSSKYGWRHYEGVAKPLARRVPWLGQKRRWHKFAGVLLAPPLRLLSRVLVAGTERARARAAAG